MSFIREYERFESTITLYHTLNALNAVFSYPKNIETKIDDLINEIVDVWEKEQPSNDIENRTIIERIEFLEK